MRTRIDLLASGTDPQGRDRRAPLDTARVRPGSGSPEVPPPVVVESAHKKPGPKGPNEALIRAIVELKSRNPRFGCPRMARIISRTFEVDIDKNVVYRVLSKHYRLRRPVRSPDRGLPSDLSAVSRRPHAHPGDLRRRPSMSRLFLMPMSPALITVSRIGWPARLRSRTPSVAGPAIPPRRCPRSGDAPHPCIECGHPPSTNPSRPARPLTTFVRPRSEPISRGEPPRSGSVQYSSSSPSRRRPFWPWSTSSRRDADLKLLCLRAPVSKRSDTRPSTLAPELPRVEPVGVCAGRRAPGRAERHPLAAQRARDLLTLACASAGRP